MGGKVGGLVNGMVGDVVVAGLVYGRWVTWWAMPYHGGRQPVPLWWWATSAIVVGGTSAIVVGGTSAIVVGGDRCDCGWRQPVASVLLIQVINLIISYSIVLT